MSMALSGVFSVNFKTGFRHCSGESNVTFGQVNAYCAYYSP